MTDRFTDLLVGIEERGDGQGHEILLCSVGATEAEIRCGKCGTQMAVRQIQDGAWMVRLVEDELEVADVDAFSTVITRRCEG